MSSNTTSTPPANGWTYTTLGAQNIPVHCGRQAFDEDLGEWLCATCDAVTHVRDIEGWPGHRPTT
ncbi:hypothetical protein [Kitasatospora terrestris]